MSWLTFHIRATSWAQSALDHTDTSSRAPKKLRWMIEVETVPAPQPLYKPMPRISTRLVCALRLTPPPLATDPKGTPSMKAKTVLPFHVRKKWCHSPHSSSSGEATGTPRVNAQPARLPESPKSGPTMASNCRRFKSSYDAMEMISLKFKAESYVQDLYHAPKLIAVSMTSSPGSVRSSPLPTLAAAISLVTGCAVKPRANPDPEPATVAQAAGTRRRRVAARAIISFIAKPATLIPVYKIKIRRYFIHDLLRFYG